MKRDVNFSIGIIEIEVKEERETDKFDLILIYWYCQNSRKKRREKWTKIFINIVNWIAEIQLLFWFY